MDAKQNLANIKIAVAALEADSVFLYQNAKLSQIKGLKFQVKKLNKDLTKANHSRGQYKSLYEKKAKECLRMKSEIELLKRRLNEK